MDIFIPIAVIVIAFLMFSICGWCCKRHRQGTVYGYGGTPVTVTQQPVTQSSVVVPPYPIDPRHPTPQMGGAVMAPPPGFAPGTGGYQQGGYPPASAPGFYCPPGPPGIYAGAPYPGGTPYPPASPYPPANSGAPYPPQTAPPPSYFEATQPTQQPAPTNELYAKQSPYNPNY